MTGVLLKSGWSIGARARVPPHPHSTFGMTDWVGGARGITGSPCMRGRNNRHPERRVRYLGGGDGQDGPQAAWHARRTRRTIPLAEWPSRVYSGPAPPLVFARPFRRFG